MWSDKKFRLKKIQIKIQETKIYGLKGFFKMCFMSEKQISHLDFALLSLFNTSSLYSGGGGPMLTPNIPVQTPKRNLFISWLAITEKKNLKTQSNSIFIISFGFQKPWSLISVSTSLWFRVQKVQLLSLAVPVLSSLAEKSSKSSSHMWDLICPGLENAVHRSAWAMHKELCIPVWKENPECCSVLPLSNDCCRCQAEETRRGWGVFSGINISHP